MASSGIWVVYHITSAHIEAEYGNESAAKRLTTRKNNKCVGELVDYAYTTKEVYNETVDVMVPTTNMLGEKGNVVMIRKSQKGGCCDPATERYHCM